MYEIVLIVHCNLMRTIIETKIETPEVVIKFQINIVAFAVIFLKSFYFRFTFKMGLIQNTGDCRAYCTLERENLPFVILRISDNIFFKRIYDTLSTGCGVQCA